MGLVLGGRVASGHCMPWHRGWNNWLMGGKSFNVNVRPPFVPAAQLLQCLFFAFLLQVHMHNFSCLAWYAVDPDASPVQHSTAFETLLQVSCHALYVALFDLLAEIWLYVCIQLSNMLHASKL